MWIAEASCCGYAYGRFKHNTYREASDFRDKMLDRFEASEHNMCIVIKKEEKHARSSP